MDKDEVIAYLTKQIDLLQGKVVEVSGQYDEITKQLKAYKELLRMYRGVYESEAGVGLQNRLPAEIMQILEKKEADDKMPSKKVKRKTRRRRKK